MKRKHKKVIARICIAALLTVGFAFLPKFDNAILNILPFLVPYLLVGYDVLWSAIRNILRGQVFDENFLMAIATVGAFGLGEYHEAVGVMIFYQIGELFQGIAVGKSRKSIAALMDIRPDSATVIRDGEEVTVYPDEVKLGETVIVKAGEKIPLDGEIIEGNTTVNSSALTGESIPLNKCEGEKVISGSVNMSGVIKIKVESIFEESTVAKILELVENSAAKKAKSENFITRFARYYTPCVVIGAALLATLPTLIFKAPFSVWLERALIFLMVSCPCALVVSVPLSFFGGIGGASKQGILIKGSNYMETLSGIDTVVFDKTGTLTYGNFEVKKVFANESNEEEILYYAAHAESFSNHPVAKSIVRKYGKDINKNAVSEVVEHAGKGVSAKVDGKTVCAGNISLMKDAGANCFEADDVGTVVHVALDGKYLGYIVISDTVKPDAIKAIERLKAKGIKKTVMLTGDSKKVAESVGKSVKVDEICSELLPADKVTKVEELLDKGNKVAFVGDGINDAPVLSRVDVGIAMGAMGSDAAIETADIVLMDDKTEKIATAIEISKKTVRIVRQNIVFALTVKGLTLALSIFGLTNMWIAVFGDVGVMIIATLNAMRTLHTKSK